MERNIWIGLVAFAVGFVIGAGVTVDDWSAGAKRGMFEIGHIVYRAEPMK